MRTFFISQDLWALASQGYTKVDATIFILLKIDGKKELLYTQKKDAKTLFVLQIRIDVSIFHKITKCKVSNNS